MPTRSGRHYATTEGAFGRVENGRIDKTWPRYKPAGPISKRNATAKGFRNRRNKCYRLAVLQCLLHTPLFYNYLCRLDDCVGDDGEDCVFCAFRDLAVEYWRNDDDRRRDRAVKRFDFALSRHSHRFDDWEDPVWVVAENDQQDAHEFLMGLLEMLQDVDGPDNGGRFANTIPNLFDMRLKQTWTCTNCGETHVRRESTRGIPGVSIADDRNNWIQDDLFDHFGPEPLPDVACDSGVCNGRKEDRTRHSVITRGPEILVVQLSRFGYDPEQQHIFKLERKVWYKQRLDLSEWTRNNFALRYQLRGVVAHSGDTANEGHYFAGLKGQRRAEFATADDEHVESDESDARLLFHDEWGGTFHPYLLVYQKVDRRRVKIG